ncbi:hypothetical protein ABNavy4_235 [Acinetobacter phage AB-Navy4]|nr:hypothetical protein ABNavy4_235 [Acinetobacter phage AB-Navy4]
MRLYRLMCKEEFDAVSEEFPLAWRGNFKWFTDNLDFLKRVADGMFNNSKFAPGRYDYLVVYDIVAYDRTLNDLWAFSRVSNHELMLRRSKQPLHIIQVVAKFKVENLLKDFDKLVYNELQTCYNSFNNLNMKELS